MVGMTRFERATPSSQARCATKLRYIPKVIFTIFIWFSKFLLSGALPTSQKQYLIVFSAVCCIPTLFLLMQLGRGATSTLLLFRYLIEKSESLLHPEGIFYDFYFVIKIFGIRCASNLSKTILNCFFSSVLHPDVFTYQNPLTLFNLK